MKMILKMIMISPIAKRRMNNNVNWQPCEKISVNWKNNAMKWRIKFVKNNQRV